MKQKTFYKIYGLKDKVEKGLCVLFDLNDNDRFKKFILNKKNMSYSKTLKYWNMKDAVVHNTSTTNEDYLRYAKYIMGGYN